MFKEHTLSVKTQHDFETLQELFSRPIVLCAKRGQEDEAMIDGFDTDFVVVIDPSDSKIAKEPSRITDLVGKKLRRRRNFCLTIDFTDKLDNVTTDYIDNIFSGCIVGFI